MHGLLVLLAWLLSAALLAPICFFATLVLAGPHGSMLPSFVQPVVLLLGWAIFLVAPVLVARAMSRRIRKRDPAPRNAEAVGP